MADAPLLEHLRQSPLIVDAMAESLFRDCILHVVRHERAETFLATTDLASEDDDFWPRGDNDWRSAYRPYNVKNGTLQIPVMGVLLNRFPWQLGRWATGYAYIEKALARGLADANVKRIAFIHDSPGGEVAGCFELGDKIYEARSEKPLRAFAADHSYSASYALSSAASKLSMSRSGGVGSIGVVTAHVEYSDMLKDLGIKVTFIFAGKHKVDGNAYEKLPESVKSRIQERIDLIYGEFVGAVARNRNMDEAKVRKTEALTYDAKKAIDIGLADSVGALEDEMIIFNAEAEIGDENMATDNTKDGVPQAKVDELVAAARTEGETAGKAAGKAEGLKEGATAERARITSILGSDEGKKRPKAAMSLAMKTALTLEEATATLADMPEEKAETKSDKKGQSHFDAAVESQTTSLSAGGDDDEDEGKGKTPATQAQSILADYRGAANIQKSKAA